MSYYKKIFKKKIRIAGSGGGGSPKPSFLMPPSSAAVKVGYQIYEALDLLCEGPVAGLVDAGGKFLEGTTARKDFASDDNVVGSSTNGIDKGVYFNEKQLRLQNNQASHSKYDMEFKDGQEYQTKSQIFTNAKKVERVQAKLAGAYDMSGPSNGARTGTGSRDVRVEGGPSRDFVNWQKYVPKEVLPKPYDFVNYDRDVDTIHVGMQIDQLFDTKSFSSKHDNEAGRSKMGTNQREKVSFTVKVGKVTKAGVKTESAAQFSTRAGNGVVSNLSNGQVAVSGVITAIYTFTLEGIALPTLSETDAYNFIRITKNEHETISNLVKRTVGVGTITYINSNNFSYPYSCYAITSIDSRYYPQVPSRTYRLKGKKILIPSNYEPINTDGSDKRFSSDTSTRGNVIYTNNGQWDGTFKFGWSDNPAWIYYDLLINTRYGIGNYLRDVNVVDKWTLYEIGMYCDAVTMHDGSKTTNDMGVAGKFIGLDDGLGGLEPRFSCNILIKDQASAFEALQDLARSFRAMTYFNNSCVSVKVDRPHFFEDFNRSSSFLSDSSNPPPKELKFPQHLIFNNLNVNAGTFSYADVDRNTKLTAVEISFLDKSNNYRSATEYVEDAEAIKNVGLNYKSIDGIGVTSRSQAHRLGKYILFESLNTTETVSFQAGTEALLIEPGDIIRVDDEMRNFSKNYGTIIGTSGETTYFDPDSTGNLSSLNNGKGPKALIVQPAINSTQFNDITGNINVYNAIGKSGIEQFYNNPSANNQLYKEIHNPSSISLKIKEGGSGTSFYRIDTDSENSGAFLIFIDGLHEFNGTSSQEESQWFSEKDALIKYGYHYSVDISGREPKYYRVIGVEEDNRNNGFNVSATIHHTGKFKFVEENISFEPDSDTFTPPLKTVDLVRPDSPAGLTTGILSKQSDNTLNLPLNITGSAVGVPQKYNVFLEEPNGNIISQEIFNSNESDKKTTITLSGDFAIDQVGAYKINVFSKTISPINASSLNPTTIEFATTFDNFDFTSTNKFLDYQDISLRTIFDDAYGLASPINTGSGNISYIENDETINSSFDLTFVDIFSKSGEIIVNDVSGQEIDLLNMQGNSVKAGLKTLTNDTEVTILNGDINSGFNYTGDSRFRMSSGINFHANSFSVPDNRTIVTTGSFEENFTETPALFIQETFSGFHNNIHKKLGRISVGSGSFEVTGMTGVSDSDAKYVYIATLTGVKNFNGGINTIETNFVQKAGSGFQAVQFSNTFDTEPRVIIQLQEPDLTATNNSRFSETTITGVSTTGFFFAAFQDNGIAASGTGQYAYIATEDKGFNNETGSDLPIECLNYATTGVNEFDFDTNLVLDQFNGTSVSNMRFNFDQYAIITQRSGDDASLIDKFFNVHRFNDKNRVFQHLLTTGLDVGVRSRNPTGSTNHIFVNTGSGSATGFNLTGVGSGMINNTGSFDGTYTGGGNLYINTTTSGLRIKLTGEAASAFVNSNWILCDDDPANSYDHNRIAWSGGQNVDHPLNVTNWTGGSSIFSGLITDSNTPLSNATTTGFHNPQINNLNVGTGDFSMIAFARFDSNLNGKQYLLESHKNGTGIAWFQSGDGKNYVNLNGVDYLAITGNGGASLNDGNVHLLQVVVDRDTALTGYLDGVTNTTINTNIMEQITGFTVANIGSGMVNNTGSFNGTYTGSNNLYVNTVTSGLRAKQSGSNNTWVFSDDDPANTYFTGFRLTGGVGSGMVDNPNSFTGIYTGGANLYINTTTSGLRIKTTGTNNTWILCDDDPANSYSHNRIAWSGGENVNFPGNVTSWTGGATIQDGTITDSVSPLNSFDTLLSHSRIAWSGGENENFLWALSNWTGGQTVGLVTTSAPTFSNLVLKTFDSQTGFKLLGNSELPGSGLTSGHIINYISLTSGLNKADYSADPNSFVTSFSGNTATEFLVKTDSFNNIKDTSISNRNVSIQGDIERSESIIDRTLTSNFHFFQIGVTGTL